ncbi:MAG TPA: mechanosensitive ion channel family protein [Acidobacteriaceae bacterium]|jgi:small conductance mechanosensitive channel|nr:mechanosensitive ion channel family protein [Acidobacteriaceae bacterium]
MGTVLLFSRWNGFFEGLGDKYVLDLQEFLHDKLPKLIAVAVIAWLLMRILKLITKHILRMAERSPGSAGHYAQLRTLMSVIRATGLTIIAFLALLQVLPILGLNLGPLLTSAGVAGVAIGLAAQNIVKDCFNGFLILIDDQFNVGDVVNIAGVSGTVETMTLRRTQVRAGDGTLYIVPNSQITTVANLTRDFSLATINVSVDFSANPDEVMAVLKEAALSVRNDPTYRDVYLADPTLLGVDGIKGSQVIYPVQLKTKPNQQWAAQRETQRRIRLALDEHGMLPGDPLRVYSKGRVQGAQTRDQGGGGSIAAEEAEAAAGTKPDPTAAKPTDVNPLTGE